MFRIIAPARLLFAAVLCLSAVPCFGQALSAFTGRVLTVPEGDTIIVVDNKNTQYKVRLAGIDAPEPGQEYAVESRNYLSGLVLDQPVTVVGRTVQDGTVIGQVFLLGRDISYTMLWAGFAWHDKELDEYQTKDDRKRYAEGEKVARNTKGNIWSQAKPVPPWDYKKDHPAARMPELVPMSAPSTAAAKPPAPAASPVAGIEIVGNRNSKIYHWNPGCPDFFRISEQNRVPFKTKAEAEAAGYRAAKNCRN